ncbi:glycoside hydrolase family 3 C-terminal domain-containing protein [Actinopolymorpha sp. B9G3]|uniref:beta-glucosidase n=1 Tax=Actinopolymorpha sp. B9G3 TaxID=3158970 RepID=UPI0032D91B5D
MQIEAMEIESAVDKALARLDLATKASLLAGKDVWSLPAVPEIGLKSLVMSDGPIGVRGTRWTPDDPSIALPSPTALAATWDPELARRVGRLLAQEARRKGVHLLLAPTVNLHRSPRGGRHFEAYSEDPFLTGRIGVGYVAGVQDGGVGVTVKHYVANDSETDRFTVDVRASDRALRELYLAPFEAIVREAGAWGVMTAYNKVDGTTMTEHDGLVNGVLKGEWGFDGVNVSDWTAARDTVGAALGGLDVAMPGPRTVFGEALARAVEEGRVPLTVVDEACRRVLRLAARVGLLAGAGPVVAPEALPEPVDGEGLAREAASRSFVLLRNDGLLPLDPGRLTRVAVIGAAAAEARVLGGGSAQVFPERVVSPLDGLRAVLPEVTYAVGADPRTKLAPAAGDFGLHAVFRAADGTVLGTQPLQDGSARWLGDLPDGVDLAALDSVEVAGEFTPAIAGTHRFGIAGVGDYRLVVDGVERFAGRLEADSDDPGAALLNPPELRFDVDLSSGRPVQVSLTHRVARAEDRDEGAFITFRLGHATPTPPADALIEQAAAAAGTADVAIVVVGTTEEVESEGFDRSSLALPGRQDELVRKVAAANARTVVVVNAGSPVEMPWRDEVAAVLLVWFPGQEAGAALADVLTGVAEPGGRLPTTWPVAAADCPILDVEPVAGVLAYDEGIFIGYRAWQRREGPAPAYWFGHGLGYTDWSYDTIDVRPASDPDLAEVTVGVRNTGTRAGREVVQVYLAAEAPEPERPARWLTGFASVSAAPGEAAEVTVTVPRRAAEVWDDGWTLVPGTYRVEVGRNAADVRVTAPLALGS